MGIKRRDHARYGFSQQFLVFNRFDIIGFYESEYIGELAQFVQWQWRCLFLCHCGKLDGCNDADDDAESHQKNVPKFVTHVSPYPVQRIVGTSIVPYFEV